MTKFTQYAARPEPVVLPAPCFFQCSKGRRAKRVASLSKQSHVAGADDDFLLCGDEVVKRMDAFSFGSLFAAGAGCVFFFATQFCAIDKN